MEKYVIALAGGPASGKSSVLRALKKMKTSEEFKVLFLDETATVFLHNRPEEVSRRDDPLLRQHYILKGQCHAERLLLENCTCADRPMVLITDRGAIDATVYLSDEDFELLGVDEQSLYARYDHAIFLEGERLNFHDDETTTRIESSYEEIAALSARAREKWSRHPSFCLIPQQDTVEMKMKLAAERINELLGFKVF